MGHTYIGHNYIPAVGDAERPLLVRHALCHDSGMAREFYFWRHGPRIPFLAAWPANSISGGMTPDCIPGGMAPILFLAPSLARDPWRPAAAAVERGVDSGRHRQRRAAFEHFSSGRLDG